MDSCSLSFPSLYSLLPLLSSVVSSDDDGDVESDDHLPDAAHQFSVFKSKFDKTYATQEEHDYRFGVFKANLRLAKRNQVLDPTAVHGVTMFSYLTPSEFHDQYLCDVIGLFELPSDADKAPILPTNDLPMRDHGAVIGVKDQNALKANNKLGFIDGSIQPPKSTESPMYSLWVQVNSMLGAWLHNTLDASIRSTVPITDDVGDMWEDIRQRFSVGNRPRIHELTSQLTRLEGGDSVVDYYGKIRMIWDELACYSAPACTCSCKCGAKGALMKEREDQKVHQFLIGLDSSIHGTVRSQILMQEPLPSLNTAFSKALTEERHHSIVRQGDKKAEAVGFAVQSSARGHGATPTKEGDKSRFTGTCSHCKKVGHDKDNCFQLLGFPDWWYSENRAAARGGGKYTRGGKGNGRGRGNVANAVGQSSGSTSGQQIGAPDRNGVQLSDAQWHHLLGMLKPSQPNDATPTHDGKYKATQWIIDTGCSNHMTGNISLFESLYDVSPSPVGLPNGNHTTAIKEGKIVLSDGLILKDVLYVPDLNVNLISVSQLLATLNYFITVTDKLCIIQDRNSRTLIGAVNNVTEYIGLSPRSGFKLIKLLWLDSKNCGIVGLVILLEKWCLFCLLFLAIKLIVRAMIFVTLRNLVVFV
ncbi:hypothetical protein JRO89_XS07G0030900 [Xanthoceras sorbifolium]|uniref:Cathepsin propeptide inhibitor domain-containing protein n=1 Tax=Xanthoceras sorbifolium TaxID=99658 RepID=A0ABQ8HS58_9ROSI|nr:hypothetical protein JRO89_XS07G0030900 [Xanthoceras sorbifolium]